jgi:hypothetical protein
LGYLENNWKMPAVGDTIIVYLTLRIAPDQGNQQEFWNNNGPRERLG